jgi:hypothetical protein
MRDEPLNIRDLAALAFRLLAMWVFAQGLASLSTIAMLFQALVHLMFGEIDISRGLMAVALGGIPSLCLIGMSVFLWYKADQIADDLYGDREQATNEASVSAEAAAPTKRETPSRTYADLLAVGFAMVGMYVLVQAVPDLTKAIASVLLSEYRTFEDAWANEYWKTEFLILVLRVVIGLVLLLGMRGLARFVRSLQRPEPPGTADPDGGPVEVNGR